MEVLTLLKANIRHKKGSFVSIIILMLIISLTFTAIISIKNNCENGIEDALDSTPNLLHRSRCRTGSEPLGDGPADQRITAAE